MEEKDTPTTEPAADTQEATTPAGLSSTHAVIIGLVVVIIVMAGFMLGEEEEPEVVTVASAAKMPTPAATAVPTPAPEPAVTTPAPVATSSPAPAAMASEGGIERHGEGRLFYTTIKIPPGAETLYLSGSGASMKADGTWGNMEEQAIDTFNKFKATLEAEGWSMADIVQVRAFAVAGDYGLLDFDGFNRGYSRFFGTTENPNKPVRSFVQVADLVVDGWLVEVEIRAARMPE